MTSRFLFSAVIAMAIGPAALAQTAPAASAPVSVKWSASDIQGQKLAVPTSDRPTAILFVRADQPQSRQAVRQALPIIKATGTVQQVLVLSGHQDMATAQKLSQQMGWTGSVVLDPDYVASGQMQIHVWPTTVLVNAAGEQVAHLASVSSVYPNELEAYLAFAAGTIDRTALTQKLATNKVVGDTSEQMALRHLQVAERLLERGKITEAKGELEEGLKLEPNSGSLKLTMAKILLIQGDAAGAATIIEKIDAATVAPWQLGLLRGKTALAQGQVDSAIAQLQGSLKLNPNPAEAQYELGKAYQQKGDHPQAAAAFRAAFEATGAGRAFAGAKK